MRNIWKRQLRKRNFIKIKAKGEYFTFDGPIINKGGLEDIMTVGNINCIRDRGRSREKMEYMER